MSDPLTSPYAVGLPTGRRLDADSGGYPEHVFGNLSMFPRATAARIEAARKNLPEIPDERLDRSTDPWVDSETGDTYELVREWLNIANPAESNATAFVVSDGWIVGLRPAAFEEKASSVHIGNLVHDGGR